jgi:hypothetical protein
MNSDKNLEWLECPVLIGGHEKSGTNLLANLLDNHPNLIGFSGHLSLFGLMSQVSSLDCQGRIEYFLNFPPIKGFKHGLVKAGKVYLNHGSEFYDYDTFRNEFKKYVSDNGKWENIIQGLFYAHNLALKQQGVNKVGFVDSTPGSEFVVDIAFTFFPKTKFIHIIREPKANWAAWKKAGKNRKERTIWQFISSWNRSVRAAARNSKKLGNERYLIVYYNSLTLEQEENIKGIAEFLAIPFDETLLKPTKLGTDWPGNSVYGTRFKGISTSSVEKYKQVLYRSEIKAIDTFCTPYYDWLRGGQASLTRPRVAWLKYLHLLNLTLYLQSNPDVKVKTYAKHLLGFVYNVCKSFNVS